MLIFFLGGLRGLRRVGVRAAPAIVRRVGQVRRVGRVRRVGQVRRVGRVRQVGRVRRVGRVRQEGQVGQVRQVGRVRVRAARAIVGQVRRVSCMGDCGTSGGAKKRFLFVGKKITLIFVAVKINI